MGDRAVLMVSENGVKHNVVCYLHWNGNIAIDLIKQALPRMRRGDASYSLARLIGHCHTQIESNLSLGCYPVDPGITDADLTHGDAGVIIYDCCTGVLNCFGGYKQDHNGENIGLPPA